MTHLYVVAFLTGVLAVFFFVSYSTLFVSLVPHERYVEGNSLVNGSRAFSYVAGRRAWSGSSSRCSPRRSRWSPTR